ncbi:transposase [Thermodesulfobium sp. 4217-1]|uniref:IS1634 family transposase n=1 Tax=Thermodesulfobium sp. 4217-1 TaxID=3120013 RepID=UPI0032215428
MSFIRKIKKKNSVYLAEVESYREEGKVKQRVIRYVGKEVDGRVVRSVNTDDIEITSCKRYLDYYLLDCISNELGLKDKLGKKAKYILLLVYTQLIEHKPLYKLPEYIEETYLKELLGIGKLIDKNIYKALDDLEELSFSEIENLIFNKLFSNSKDKDALIIDITDAYFSGSKVDYKSRRGKDGKVGKLIQIALAVTKEEGIPIMHKVYEGNINNVKIFQDFLLEARMKQFSLVLIDRGMSSFENITELNNLNQKTICGFRMNKKIQSDYLSNIDRDEIFQPINRVKLKNTSVYVKDFSFFNGKLIAIYNPEIEIAKRNFAIETDEFDIDKAKYFGYSLVYHNTDMSSQEVVRLYYERDIVEKAFKELKSSIDLHPIRKYRMDHIKAHIKICYIAFAILTYIKQKTKSLGISPVDVLETLQSCYIVNLRSEKHNLNWTKTVTLKNQQKLILKLLGCSV